MKRDLVKIGEELAEKVPFHTIVREFEIKGAKFRIRVGWDASAVVEAYKPRSRSLDNDWVDENWSTVPRGLLQSLTKSIKEEANALLKGMDDFIEKECEAEIRETITDIICKKDVEATTRQEIFCNAIESRFKKMNDHFKTFSRPSTFNEFSIERTFAVPKPLTVDQQRWDKLNKHIAISITQDGFAQNEAVATPIMAMMYLLTMPQIAEFVLKVYTQLAQLAEWEKKQ